MFLFQVLACYLTRSTVFTLCLVLQNHRGYSGTILISGESGNVDHYLFPRDKHLAILGPS